MGMRRTLTARRALTAVAITTGLVLTVAGCFGDGDDKSDKENTGSTTSPSATDNQEVDKDDSGESQTPAEDTILAEVQGGDSVTLTINSAVRDQGGFLTVNGKVKNGGAKTWVATNWKSDERELLKNSASMAGATVVDKAGKKRYLILRDTSGRCLCTKFPAFQAGDEKTFYAQFPAPPEGTKSVEFNIGDMPPATIEISESE